jgi:periplasmic copper chaperone A
MRSRVLGLAVVAVLAMGAAACGDSDDDEGSSATTAAPEAQLVVADAWCRTSPAMATAGACYMTITNDGSEDDALVSASVPSSIAGTVELHETVAVASGGDDTMADEMSDDTMADDMSDDTAMGMGEGSDMMEMRQVGQIDLPAGETVSLEPGGLHVMLLELPQPLEEGSTVELTLTFETGDPQTVDAEVRSS